MGRGRSSGTVYIIDYGLAKRFRNITTHEHIPYKDGKKLTGTARFASIKTHLGIEQSRRDDVECLGYTLIYLAKGTLPWQGVKEANKQEKYNRIGEKKSTTPIRELCDGLPPEFGSYMHYCAALGFEDKPDYTNLKRCFRACFVRGGFEAGFCFDWENRRRTSASSKECRASSNGTGKADCCESPKRVSDMEMSINKSCTQTAKVNNSKETSASPPMKGTSCINLRRISQADEPKEIPSPTAKMFLGAIHPDRPKELPSKFNSSTKGVDTSPSHAVGTTEEPIPDERLCKIIHGVPLFVHVNNREVPWGSNLPRRELELNESKATDSEETVRDGRLGIPAYSKRVLILSLRKRT